MTEMSAKNTLQEYFQKKGLSLPKYNTIRCGGADHTPLWKSTVILTGGYKFEGNVNQNKTKAEEDAAITAHNWLKSNDTFSRIPENGNNATNVNHRAFETHSYSENPNATNVYHRAASEEYGIPNTTNMYYRTTSGVDQILNATNMYHRATPEVHEIPMIRSNVSNMQNETYRPNTSGVRVDMSNLCHDTSVISPNTPSRSIRRNNRGVSIDSTHNTNIIPAPSIHRTILFDQRTVLLVDVENLPNFIDDVCKEIQGLSIYAFIGYHHALCDKQFAVDVNKVLSPSTRTDGTDSCMQVYVGYFLANNKYDTYLIATRDHFGSSLVDMITSKTLLWPAKKARVVTKVRHIYKV
jgi:hypothetical protein